MRTRITLAIVGLAVLVVSGLMAWPRIEDQIRESRCDFYLNESKRTPSRWVRAFFEREDEPAGWRTFLDHLGAKRIGDYNAESYRVVLIPMIR